MNNFIIKQFYFLGRGQSKQVKYLFWLVDQDNEWYGLVELSSNCRRIGHMGLFQFFFWVTNLNSKEGLTREKPASVLFNSISGANLKLKAHQIGPDDRKKIAKIETNNFNIFILRLKNSDGVGDSATAHGAIVNSRRAGGACDEVAAGQKYNVSIFNVTNPASFLIFQSLILFL